MTRSVIAKTVKFTSSTKSVDDGSDIDDNGSVSSASRTPSPIPAPRTSDTTNKQPIRKVSFLRVQNEGKQPAKAQAGPTIAYKQSPSEAMHTRKIARSSDNEHVTPSPKRRRMPRKSKTPVVYSQKWHPMDDIMNPKRAAKVRKGVRPSNHVGSDIDSSEDETEALPVVNDDSASEDEVRTPVKSRPRSTSQPPSPDRRRSIRNAGKAETPNYSQKYHPMDAVTKPNARATIAAQANAQRKRSLSSDVTISTSSSLSTLLDDGSTTDITIEESSEQKANSRLVAISKPSFSKMQHVELPDLPEHKSRTSSPVKLEDRMTTKLTLDRDSSKHSKKNPSSSASVLQSPTQITKPVGNLASKSQSNLLADPLSDPDDGAGSMPPPSWSNLGNPYVRRRALDPEKLGSLDKILYNYQRGAPLNSETLPHTWQDTKQMLFDHGEISLDDLNGKEATGWLKKRYEDLRLGIEAFFSSAPEPSVKKDWPLTLAEGFDVFDKPIGVKYWKHRRESILDCATMDSGVNHIRKLPETDVGTERDNLTKYWKHQRNSVLDRATFDSRVNYIRKMPETKVGGERDNLTDKTAAMRKDVKEHHATYRKSKAKRKDTAKHEATKNDEAPDGIPRPTEAAGLWSLEAAETGIVNLENFDEVESETTTFMEIMQAKDVQSSEAMMDRDEMSELFSTTEQVLADIPNESDAIGNNTSNGSIAATANETKIWKATQHETSDIKSANQPDIEAMDGNVVAAKRDYGSQPLPSEIRPILLPSVELGLESTIELTNAVPGDESEGQRSAKALYLAKKRRSKTISPEEVNIYEDSPGRSPVIERIVAQNPPSPGTDLPTENLEEVQNSSQRSSQGELRTPRANRRRHGATTPIGRSLIRPATGNTGGPYRSIFGGPPRPQSSSPNI
ncbi:hypothetical protein P7C71_g6155, partial [Lecanoromycetidae sp. Uapishka_2]